MKENSSSILINCLLILNSYPTLKISTEILSLKTKGVYLFQIEPIIIFLNDYEKKSKSIKQLDTYPCIQPQILT